MARRTATLNYAVLFVLVLVAFGFVSFGYGESDSPTAPSATTTMAEAPSYVPTTAVRVTPASYDATSNLRPDTWEGFDAYDFSAVYADGMLSLSLIRKPDMDLVREASRHYRNRLFTFYVCPTEPHHVTQACGTAVGQGTFSFSEKDVVNLSPIPVDSCNPGSEWIVVSASELSDDKYNGWRHAPCPASTPAPAPTPTPAPAPEPIPSFCDLFQSPFCLNAANRNLYDDTFYGQLVYNEYDGPETEYSRLLPNIENYNIVIGTADPGNRCPNLAENNNRVRFNDGRGGNEGEGENVRDFIGSAARAVMNAASNGGRFPFVENPWKGSISVVTGNATAGPGKIVVRFSSAELPEYLAGALAYASVGRTDDAHVTFVLNEDCNLQFAPGGFAIKVVRHELGHALGFRHVDDSYDSIMSYRKYSRGWSSFDHNHIEHTYVLGNRARRRPGFPGAKPDGFEGPLD